MNLSGMPGLIRCNQMFCSNCGNLIMEINRGIVWHHTEKILVPEHSN
jgi:hypothetical protein